MFATIIYFILGLSLLIFIHELGHFTFAKLFNVYVYEFSLFMGPKIVQKKGKETKYTLRCIPIGGYCSMAGEQDSQATRNMVEDEEERKYLDQERPVVPFERTINGIKWIKKFLILFGGPLFNFILGFFLLIIYFAGTQTYNYDPYITVQQGSILAQAGLQTGDKVEEMVIYLEGDKVISIVPEGYLDISSALSKANPSVDDTSAVGKTQCLDITYTRNGETKTIKNVCRTYTKYEVSEDESGNKTVTSIEPIYGMSITYRDRTFSEVMKESIKGELDLSLTIFKGLGSLFQKGGLQNVSGVIGMYEGAEYVIDIGGFYYFMWYLAMISVNLGIVNLVPFPALDGGRLLIMIIEKCIYLFNLIKKKITHSDEEVKESNFKLSTKAENSINTIGFIILLGLIIVVTFKDIFTKWG